MRERLWRQQLWSVPWPQSAQGHQVLPVQSRASSGAFERQHKGERLLCLPGQVLAGSG